MLWHQGTFACVTSSGATYVVDDFFSESIEAEANRFAGEILIPTQWAQKTAKKLEYNVEKVFNEIKDKCQTSAPASFMGLGKAFPPGYLFLLRDVSTDKVLYQIVSEETKIKFPKVTESKGRLGQIIYNKDISYREIKNQIKDYTNYGVVDLGKYKLNWWQYNFSDEFEENFSIEESRLIIKRILDDVYGDENSALKNSTRGSVNGIAATVNSHANFKSANDLYSVMKQNFYDRGEEVKKVVRHADFEKYLKNKAHELFNNKKKK